MLRVATERLYYHDPYLTEFEAGIVKISPDGCRIFLDQTAFYPSSGGQPNDFGSLGGQPVVDVLDDDEGIAHIVAAPLSAGNVAGKIDWERRYDHMQQHTGQHLLSAVLADLCGFQTLSFHMGSDVSTIELGTKDLTETQIDGTEKRANELARRATPVRITFEDADRVEGLRKQSERSGTLRIVEIEGIDKSACGGTHVRSLSEVLPLQIRKLEKVRGNVRIEFVCGWRASRRAKQDFRILQDLARQSATPIDKLPEYVAAAIQRLSDAEKERHRLAESLAQREGREAYAATAVSDDGLRRALWEVEQISDLVRLKASSFVTGAKSLLLVTGKQPAGLLIACSSDSGIDAGVLLKQTLAQFGGRGGGSTTLAQGTAPNSDCIQVLAGKLGLA
jgi:alanyl-tRNA synthetase